MVEADLHCHSWASDGTLSPRHLVYLARSQGLKALAVTDHDTVGGLLPAQQAGLAAGIQVIPGVELSCDTGDMEVHLLGLFIANGSAALLKRLEELRQARTTRGKRMLRRLQEMGVKVTWEQVLSLSGGGVVGRPHLAGALVQSGVVPNEAEAFSRYLDRGRPAYVPRMRLAPVEALRLIHMSGGVAVLAHPGLSGSLVMTEELAEEGLDAIEVYYPKHSAEQTLKLLNLADRYGLLVTGGSDFHRVGELSPGAAGVGIEAVRALRLKAGLPAVTGRR